MHVLELFSGIGGMSFSLDFIPEKKVTAIEINDIANKVYNANFPNHKVMTRNITSLTANELDNFDIWTMSPPCQPFTVQNDSQQLGLEDARSNAMIHLMNMLQVLKVKPKYFFLENVAGFASSEGRSFVVDSLKSCGYFVTEFVLNPIDFGIPNSRNRFYILARKTKFSSELEIQFERKCIESYLDTEKRKIVPDSILKYSVLDIVLPSDDSSNCFTKGYTKLAEGSGSVLQGKGDLQDREKAYTAANIVNNRVTNIEVLRELHLQFFSPVEVSRLLGFHNLVFPSEITDKQKYKLLGNSINVDIVRKLLQYLLSDSV